MSKELKKNLNILNQQLYSLKREYGVRKMGIFGSFARGDQKRNSDIDILVEFSKPIGLFKFINLENHLTKTLNRKVDLVTRNALKRAIKNDVLKEIIYV